MRTKRITRTTELTIETSHFAIAPKPHPQIVAWCERCLAEASLVTPEDASSLLRVSLREIYRRVEAGRVHFIETRDGRLLICASSLLSGQYRER